MKTLTLSLMCAAMVIGMTQMAWATAAPDTVTVELTSEQLASAGETEVTVSFTREQADKIQAAFPEWKPVKTITVKKTFIYDNNMVTLKFDATNGTVAPVPRT
jgi:hypothetical protein